MEADIQLNHSSILEIGSILNVDSYPHLITIVDISKDKIKCLHFMDYELYEVVLKFTVDEVNLLDTSVKDSIIKDKEYGRQGSIGCIGPTHGIPKNTNSIGFSGPIGCIGPK